MDNLFAKKNSKNVTKNKPGNVLIGVRVSASVCVYLSVHVCVCIQSSFLLDGEENAISSLPVIARESMVSNYLVLPVHAPYVYSLLLSYIYPCVLSVYYCLLLLS